MKNKKFSSVYIEEWIPFNIKETQDNGYLSGQSSDDTRGRKCVVCGKFKKWISFEYLSNEPFIGFVRSTCKKCQKSHKNN